jgi:hypothetical protein
MILFLLQNAILIYCMLYKKNNIWKETRHINIGETLIEAGYNGQQYLKQLDQVIPILFYFFVVYYSTPLRIMFMISSFIPLLPTI